jgi:hypothetical protein
MRNADGGGAMVFLLFLNSRNCRAGGCRGAGRGVRGRQSADEASVAHGEQHGRHLAELLYKSLSRSWRTMRTLWRDFVATKELYGNHLVDLGIPCDSTVVRGDTRDSESSDRANCFAGLRCLRSDLSTPMPKLHKCSTDKESEKPSK